MPKQAKYHKWLTEEGLIKIGGWAKDGLSDKQIAHNMGISRSTLCIWKNKFLDISDTLKINKEVVDRQVENALLKRALGYEYEEVQTTMEEVDGKQKKKITKTKKHMAGDTTAMAIWLNNRKPEQYRRNRGKEELDRERFEHEKEIDSKKWW